MKEKKKALDELVAKGPTSSAEADALRSRTELIQIVNQFPLRPEEVTTLADLGYNVHLAISIINSRGLKKEEDEEEEEEEADADADLELEKDDNANHDDQGQGQGQGLTQANAEKKV